MREIVFYRIVECSQDIYISGNNLKYLDLYSIVHSCTPNKFLLKLIFF